MLLILLQSQPASSQRALPDPFSVPAAERIQWQRRLADIGEGRNGRELYERVHAAFVAPDDPKHEAEIGKQTALWLLSNSRNHVPFKSQVA